MALRDALMIELDMDSTLASRVESVVLGICSDDAVRREVLLATETDLSLFEIHQILDSLNKILKGEDLD